MKKLDATKRDKIKHFSWGLVTGAVALGVVAFSAGWVVSTGAMDKGVRIAWIDGQASACASLVMAHRESTGDITDLIGYDARDARDTLAQTFAVVLPGEEIADAAVIRACSIILNRPIA
jgi:hypothetical protein